MRIWREHDPARTLLAAFAAVAPRGDYGAGYRAMRRVVALGETWRTVPTPLLAMPSRRAGERRRAQMR